MNHPQAYYVIKVPKEKPTSLTLLCRRGQTDPDPDCYDPCSVQKE